MWVCGSVVDDGQTLFYFNLQFLKMNEECTCYVCTYYLYYISVFANEEVMSFLFTSFLFQIAFVFFSSKIPGKFIKVIPYKNSGAIVTIM